MSLRISLADIRFPSSTAVLIPKLDLEIAPGKLVLIKGRNGSGKSTLLNCVAGVIPEHIPAQGKIMVQLDDIALHTLPLRHKSPWLAYQMADPALQLLFPNIEKELSFALENIGMAASGMRLRIANALHSLGLDESCPPTLDPHLLSQGQKKLLMLAVCQAMETPVILLDEPSASLSARGRETLIKWVAGLLQNGRMILAAEHHPCLDGLAAGTIDLNEL